MVILSCSKEKKIKISEKNFEEEVPVKGMLSFTFNQDMIPDSLVGKWTNEELISIDPIVEGKCHWQSKYKLVFIPAEEFKPATDYTARFSNNVFKYSKGSYKDQKEFPFHTPYLQMMASRAFWHASGEEAEPGIKVEMDFNYNVLPSEVEKLLEVKVNKQTRSFQVLTGEISDKISILVSGIEKEDKDYPVEVALNKGLKPGAGGSEIGEKVIKQFDIPSPFKLNITDFQANHDGSEGTITLYTTQEVSAESIKKFISIEPGIKYSVDIQPGYILLKSENFDINSKYDLVIKKGLTGKLGGTLKYDYEQPVSFGKLKPTIRFYDQKEFYVSGKGSRNIQVSIISIPKVKITVWKVYENNIVNYFGHGNSYYYDDYYYEDEEYYYDDYYYESYGNPGNLGDVVYEKEIETSTLPSKGSNKLLTLDFEDKLADYKGIYVIEVKSAEEYYPRATKMVAVSDIGLIVKKGKNNITVFANSVKTAGPLANVTIKVIGNNNQVTHTMKTDAKGVATYEYSELLAEGFNPSLITAQLEGDFNMIPVKRTEVNTSRFDVGGKYQNPSGMEAFIYGDRNLYRPGETVNLTAIIRDYKWNSPGNIPVILKVTSPQGKNYKTIKKILNDQGAFETQFELPSSAQTGTYSVGVYTTNEVYIGYSYIKVEEFMPDRIKVKVELDQESYKPGEEVDMNITAENFFGPPAAGRNYEVQMNTNRINFYPKKNRGYSYYITGGSSSFSSDYREDVTDEEGKAYEQFEIPREYRNMGILHSTLFTTVFDETGRPVNRLNNFKIYTQDVFYGIKCDDYYVKTGYPVKFDLIAVDKEGNELDDTEAEIKLIRIEYKTVLTRSGSYFRYKSERVENIIENKKIKLNGTSSSYSFIPEFSGQYEMRITKPGVYTYVERDIYAYGWGSTSYSSFKVNNEGQIDIETDKESYNVGDKANVILKAPFTGKMLISVETDKVLDYFYVETDKRAASFVLDIKEEYVPNVYISATLFRPHEESDIPLTVAHGFAPVKVENPENKMDISITAPDKSRSNTKQVIKVKGKPNSALTIAVVDEGILQVAGYPTPDPYGFFYSKRALEVSTSNIYPYLFPEVNAVRSYTGGDGGEMEKRLNPMQNNRVKLVSFWSGILNTNSKGEASYEISIPQFSGDLRIMAVGYDGKVFGSKQGNMKVADPLVISVALPRFLSPGDKTEVPVIMTNTTGKKADCKVTLKLTGPLQVNGSKSMSVSIDPNKEGKVKFIVDALYKLGEGSVTIEVEAMGETFVNKTDITVRPASPLQKRSNSGTVKAGSTEELNVDVNEFMESSIMGKLIISKNPLVRFTKSLDYLVHYPYGCVEQTVSGAFPQLYFGDLMNIVYSEEKAKNDAVRNVQAALDRIKLMQLYNGGLTYWPGGGSETWWGSVYAAHFAIEAKKAGYEVDETFINSLLKYLKNQLQEKRLFTYYYNRTMRKQIAPKEVAYSLYVLTLAGEKPKALMNYYRARTEQLSLDAKYMLAGAYVLIGDPDKAKEILPGAFEGEESNTIFGGSFYSYVRDEAIALNVLLETDPDNPQVAIMAKHISQKLANSRYLNTQERCFGFLAMGKIARIAAGTDIKGQVKAGGKVVASFNNNDISVKLDKDINKKLTITTEGKGTLYYYWESEGISVDGSYLEEDSYIKVRKTFYDRNGYRKESNTFKQNDLILVELSVNSLTSGYIDNVAISDILPACFEIENPRLTTLPPGMDYPDSRSYPEYMDIRDDRINMFSTVGSYTRNYYYLVRVVSAGVFNMGPVGADAMYAGEYHSYSGGGKITVESK